MAAPCGDADQFQVVQWSRRFFEQESEEIRLEWEMKLGGEHLLMITFSLLYISLLATF